MMRKCWYHHLFIENFNHSSIQDVGDQSQVTSVGVHSDVSMGDRSSETGKPY